MIRLALPAQSHPRRAALRSAGTSAGFTLVEMLVVLTIIALILGLVGPRVLNYLGESRSQDRQAANRELRLGAGSVLSGCGALSDHVRGPQRAGAAAEAPKSGTAPTSREAKCPPIHGVIPISIARPLRKQPYEIVSYGADGREGGSGTAADISNVEH